MEYIYVCLYTYVNIYLFLFFYFLRQGFTLVAQAGVHGVILTHCNLHLLGASDAPVSASQVAGITEMRHHARLILYY